MSVNYIEKSLYAIFAKLDTSALTFNLMVFPNMTSCLLGVVTYFAQ